MPRPAFSRVLRGVLAVALLHAATSAPAAVSAVAVKAAYLSKFAAYVTWPPNSAPSAGAPIVICVVGRDPFRKMLDQAIANQLLDQHPLLVRRVARVDVDTGCHIAFLGGSSAQSVAAALESLQAAPVLTVTDERTAGSRGILHLQVERNRVGFHVDTALAARNSLSISSKLLELALSVTQRGQP